MRKSNQLISKILTVAILFGTVSITAPALSYAENAKYVDVENHWAQASIERWSDYEIVNGNEIGEFLPDANMTRGQLAKVLATLLGLNKIPTDNPFSDVPEDEWYTPFMLRCYEAGIILGSEGMGMPEANISRQESMVMIARALGIEPMDTAELSDFSDASGVEPWAAGYIAALISKGIVSGIADNILAPAETINRASVMTVLDRSIGQYINKGGVHELVENAGIVLVVSGDVTLTGSTDANLIISPACAGKAVAFDGAVVTGTVTVQTDSCVISENNSRLSEIKNIGATSVIGDIEKPEEVAGTAGGGGAAGGGGGGFTPNPAPVQTPSITEKIETIGLYYEAADSKVTSIIKPQVVEGKAYLFLPSSADYSSIYFTASDTTELRGTVQGAALATTANSNEKLDLTAIFGAMNPGTQYPMKAKCGTTECEIILMQGANIPSLHIALDESELPNGYGSTLGYIHEDKNNKLPGNLVMVGVDGSVVAEVLKQLKGRGNYTWCSSGEKRPYNVKLDKKQELIPNAGKAKNWCLLANNAEGNSSGLPNTIAYKSYELLNGAFAIATQSVDLYINNEYRGVYLLTEKVEIGSTRVDITETKNNEDEDNVTHIGQEATDDPAIQSGVLEYQYATNSVQQTAGGFLLEIDFYSNLEPSWFRTRQGVIITIKNPEFATKEQVQRISMYVQEFEDALYSPTGFNNQGKHYSEYIDLDSWAKQYILECFTANWDMMGGSSFISIDSNSETLQAKRLIKGPAWDYDGSGICLPNLFSNKIGMNVETDMGAFNNIWAIQLLRKGDFVKALENISSNQLKNIWYNLRTNKANDYIEEISASYTMDDMIWVSNFYSKAMQRSSDYSYRYDYWYNTIWTDANLKGITISNENGTLTANVVGSATSYQWYRCDSATPAISVAIDGATTAYYTPTENGIYYVEATGGNIGYNPYAAENPEQYTTNGVLSMVALPTITMNSNPIYITSF